MENGGSCSRENIKPMVWNDTMNNLYTHVCVCFKMFLVYLCNLQSCCCSSVSYVYTGDNAVTMLVWSGLFIKGNSLTWTYNFKFSYQWMWSSHVHLVTVKRVKEKLYHWRTPSVFFYSFVSLHVCKHLLGVCFYISLSVFIYPLAYINVYWCYQYIFVVIRTFMLE